MTLINQEILYKIIQKPNKIAFIFGFFTRKVRSLFLSRYVDNKNKELPINLISPNLKVIIDKDRTAKLIINGTLKISSYMYGTEPVMIRLGKNSKLVIDGDFIIGNGTQIYLNEESNLYIGGQKNESGAGITEKSRIMVKKNIVIGHDCIFSWGVFITDCDWHSISGIACQQDVHIGNHVWLASNVSVLKGVTVGDDSIIGTNTVISGKQYPHNSLILGIPGEVVKKDLTWSRDMIG
jgi:acetyltransferase-like isoleucine patch superfamily enzyme